MEKEELALETFVWLLITWRVLLSAALKMSRLRYFKNVDLEQFESRERKNLYLKLLSRC